MIVGAAEEAEAVGQDFERPLAEHQAVDLHPLFQDAKDQVLPLEAGDFGQVLLAGLFDELRHAHPLQLGDVGLALLVQSLERLGGPFEVAAVGQFGQLFGQRQRLAFRLDLAQDFEVLRAELGGAGRRRVVAAVDRSVGRLLRLT